MSTRLCRLSAPKQVGRLPCATAPARRDVVQPGAGETIPSRTDGLLAKPPPAADIGVAALPRDLLSPEQIWRYSTASHNEGPLND